MIRVPRLVTVAVLLAAARPGGAFQIGLPPGCETAGVHMASGVDFAVNLTEIVNAPTMFRPASTTPQVHALNLVADVLAAKAAIDEVDDTNAWFPYDAATLPSRWPVDRNNIQNSDYPLLVDGRSEIGFIPILEPLFAAAVPWVMYEDVGCTVVESDVWLSSLYFWAFGKPADHGEPNYGAGLCVGGAIRPGLACGLLNANAPMFARPVLVHEFLAVLGFDVNSGQHSFRNDGTYPWQGGSTAFDPRVVLLPDDRAGLRYHYPTGTPTGELDLGVVNTAPDPLDGGRNKLLCAPGIGATSSPSDFDPFCSGTPATFCAGDVVNVRFSIVNNGTTDVTVTPDVRFTPLSAMPNLNTAPRIQGTARTVAAGASTVVSVIGVLPPGLTGGVGYRVWGGADTGALLGQERGWGNNWTPARGAVTMGPGCNT